LLSAVPDNYLDQVEYEGVEILAAEVHPGKDCGWTRVSEETAVPTRIVATLYTADPLLKLDLSVQVDWAGRGIVRELNVLTDGPQTGISISLLRRIPVDTLMRFAMAQASVPIRLRPDIQAGAFQLQSEPENSPTAWVSGGPLEPGRGRDTPPDRIARVAEIYKDAVANGSRSPVDMVVKMMGYSSATASRDLKEARKRGLLPPAGAKGGRTPTSAIAGSGRIERMSSDSFNRVAEEMGLQGSGPKGKRLAELTPDEFEEIVRSARGTKHPGVPTDGQEEFLDEQRRAGHQVVENRRPHDDSGPL
jgi:hypothetical protein